MFLRLSDAVRFSRTNTAIIEEFIDGEELSLDIYVEDGRANALSVSSLDKIAVDGMKVLGIKGNDIMRRDLASIKNAMHGVDYIFHAAALKQVLPANLSRLRRLSLLNLERLTPKN